jgi:hypothetical protein
MSTKVERQIRGGGLSLGPGEFDRAVEVLGALACRLLEDLLGGSRGLKPKEWFRDRDAVLFECTPMRRLHVGRMLLQSIGFVRHGPRSALALMRQTRLQHDPGRAIPALRGDLGVAWHGSDGFVVPERLWELVGRAAWTSPGFQADASRILTGHLRKRLLVGADDFPVPRLRVEILWLLVVAAPIRETLLTRLGGRRSRRAIARIKAAGESILARSPIPVPGGDWHQDFWSQWIGWQISRNPNLPQIRASVAPHLAAMPLVGKDPGADALSRQARILKSVYTKWYLEKKEPRRRVQQK